MDSFFRSFKERLKKFISHQASHDPYDVEQLRIWARDLEQYPSCESVPFEDWDANLKHLEFLSETSADQEHERAALAAFVRENISASLQRIAGTAT